MLKGVSLAIDNYLSIPHSASSTFVHAAANPIPRAGLMRQFNPHPEVMFLPGQTTQRLTHAVNPTATRGNH
jgi:hypothetical protein